MREITLVGIGCGNPDHMTLQGIAALQGADLILLPEKPEKPQLAQVREQILARHLGAQRPRIASFAMPRRERGGDYLDAVDDWHRRIARAWTEAMAAFPDCRHVALLVWGDPALYDSTIRIARRLDPDMALRVVPGVSAVSVLAAAHGIPLNHVSSPVAIMPARQLTARGWPEGFESVVVMLDDGHALEGCKVSAHIYWGAYLGMPQEMLVHGPLTERRGEILALRKELRARHGWIMDIYLLTTRAP